MSYYMGHKSHDVSNMVQIKAHMQGYIKLRSKVYILLSESAISSLVNKIRGIVQNACYCLFSTDLIEIFHIKDVESTRENNS